MGSTSGGGGEVAAAAKRSLADDEAHQPADDGVTPAKKALLFISETFNIGPVSTLEEMNHEVLKIQHGKLIQRYTSLQKKDEASQNRISQLEARQMQADEYVNVVNRYWDQLDEDIRVQLKRFESRLIDKDNSVENEGKTSPSFLNLLSTWDKTELHENLDNRVKGSVLAVEKLIQACDRISQCVNMTWDGKSADHEKENPCLQNLNTATYMSYRVASLNMKEIQEKLTAKEAKCDELQNQVAELNWEVSNLNSLNEKLMYKVQELTDKCRNHYHHGLADHKVVADTIQRKSHQAHPCHVGNSSKDFEELSNDRLQELERLQLKIIEHVKELEKLRFQLRELPEHVVVQTAEYQGLQRAFSLVNDENTKLRTALNNSKQYLESVKSCHRNRIDEMENEKLFAIEKLNREIRDLQESLDAKRKDEIQVMMEIELFLKTNEQVFSGMREMRLLIQALVKYIHQRQVENQNRKPDQCSSKTSLTDHCAPKTSSTEHNAPKTPLPPTNHCVPKSSPTSSVGKDDDAVEVVFDTRLSAKLINTTPASSKDSPKPCNSEVANGTPSGGSCTPNTSVPLVKVDARKVKKVQTKEKDVQVDLRSPESDCVEDLKEQLQQATKRLKDTMLLLDVTKGACKEGRDKVQIMADEARIRQELYEVKDALKKMNDERREERKRLAMCQDAMKRVKTYEIRIHELKQQLAAQKQEAQMLFRDMEVTGQACDELQEKNASLIEQIKAKEKATLETMSESIKVKYLHKVACEELDKMTSTVSVLQEKVQVQNEEIRILKENPKQLLSTIDALKKENARHQHAIVQCKQKAFESERQAVELKCNLQKYQFLMKDVQQTISDKSVSLEKEIFKNNRLHEQIVMLERKLDLVKKVEMAGSLEEVLKEEIREYKEILTCPSCKVKQKDAVLLKCFHAFCFDCLKTRYVTRQRKCPQCNACFGANDYRRLYLS